MEEEFNSLNLGVTWSVFGNADRSDIDDLLKELDIHGPKRLVVVDLWKRHPNNPANATSQIDASSDVAYRSESTIISLHKHGLRGTVYDLAAAKGAYHSNEEKTSIAYVDSGTLSVCVLFLQKSQCGIFQSALETMVKRFFDSDAVVIHNRMYTVVKSNTMAVLPSDYVSADNPESRDYSVFSGLSSQHDLIVDSTMQPILWENANMSCFKCGSKGNKCHLMSQTSFAQHADNVNNFLIMSVENHYRFDGNSPTIAIRWVSSTDRTVIINEEEVTFCNIAIECLNDEVFKVVGIFIKAGTKSDPDTLTYYTSVAKPDPAQFKQFLTFKYLETKGLQRRSGEPEHPVAKMSRVRAEVKEIMEQDPNTTIDLNIKRKNKRSIVAVGVEND